MSCVRYVSLLSWEMFPMWHKPLNLSPLFFTVPACLTMEAWESTHIIYDVKMLYIFFGDWRLSPALQVRSSASLLVLSRGLEQQNWMMPWIGF
jgi:hypothetical protein